MKIEKNLKLINIFALFYSTWFFVPVLVPFAKEHLNVGFQGVVFSESLFALAMVILDVPTGWLSDAWKRKHVLALGGFLNAVGCGILLISHSLFGLIVSQLFMGFGISLFNGTHTALLYESLMELGREEEYSRREGKRLALGLYGATAAGVIGGLTYPLHPYLPIILAILTQSAACLISLRMIEPARHKKTDAKHPVTDIIDTIKFVLFGKEQAALIILLAALLFSATKTIMWSQQPYYLALHIPVAFFGMLMSSGWLLGGIASHLAHHLDGKINNFRAVTAACGTAVLFSAVAGLYLSYGGAALLILTSSCIYGLVSPRINEIINQSVESSRRATLLSTQSFLVSLIFLPISNLLGWVSDRWGIQNALLVVSLWIACTGAALLFWKRRLAASVLFTPRAP